MISLEESRDNEKTIINIIPYSKRASETVIGVGDKVIAKITRINTNQANADIIAIGDNIIKQTTKGIIRREDIRLNEVDKLVIHECFRPGDIVLGRVISLGDSRQYYLSTADVELGVRWAKSQLSGNIMTPISWKVINENIT